MPAYSPRLSRWSRSQKLAEASNVSLRSTRKNCLETLEKRQLMAVVDVTSFGAVANDGRDDSGSIVSAMRAANAGDTISFPAGTFNINRRVDVKGGLTIKGIKEDISTIKVADGMHAFRFQQKGLTINDITFIGGGLFLDSIGSRPVQNLTIERVHFTEFDHGSDVGAGSGAIGAPGSRVNNLTIADCTFDNSRHGMSFYAWAGDNWLIADNAFINTNGGVKTNNGGSLSKNIRVIRNYWGGTSRMGAEMQGQVHGFLFADNFYERPVMSPNFGDNINTFAFSLIYHGITTRSVEITRNTVIAPERPDGTGVRLAFEVGNDANVHDNYVNGIGTTTSVYMGDSSGGSNNSNIGYTYVQNNRFLDAKWGIGNAYGPIKHKAIYRNNGPSTELTWDITRGRPGPGGGFNHEPAGGGGLGGGGWWGGDPQPQPAPGYGVPLLTAYVYDSSRIGLSWTDLFSDEAGFRVERSVDNGQNFKTVWDSFAPNITQYTDKGLPSGTQFMYRVFAYKQDGSGVHSVPALAKTRGAAPSGGTGPTGTGGNNGGTGGPTNGGGGTSRSFSRPSGTLVNNPPGSGSDDPLNGMFNPGGDNPFGGTMM